LHNEEKRYEFRHNALRKLESKLAGKKLKNWKKSGPCFYIFNIICLCRRHWNSLCSKWIQFCEEVELFLRFTVTVLLIRN